MTKEQAISRVQYLDLVYSQFDTLYDLIPHAPRPTYDPSEPPQAHSDGITGLAKSTLEKLSLGKTSTSNATNKTFAKTISTPTKNSDVNAMQTIQSKNPPLSGGKKNKKKKKIPLNKTVNKRKKNLLQIIKERGKYDSHAWFVAH